MEADLNVDWRAPWFEPWRDVGERVLHAWRTMPLCDALNSASCDVARPAGCAGVEFVGHQELGVEPYEAFIFRTRQVPTRENAHDFFNGLAWLKFPLEKSRLNELQSEQIAMRGIAGARGPVRDAITLLDENGAFLDAPDALWAALLDRDWRRSFRDLRPSWRDARLVVFGHALLEKLLAPRKALTAHVWCGPREFTAERLAAKPFTPLPVLGVPGWCAQNQDVSFYDDPRVFRARW